MITIKTKPAHDFKELKKNTGLENLYAFRAIKKQIEDKYNFKFVSKDAREMVKEFYYKFVREV